MTDDQVHSALVRWLAALTGAKVIKAHQSGLAPAEPYIAVNLTGTVAVRQWAQTTEYEEAEPDTGEEFGDVTARPLIEAEWRFGDIDNVAMARASNALYPGRAPATIRRHLYVPVSAIINFVKDDKLRPPKGGGARTMFVMPSLADKIIQAATTQPSPWLPALITFLFGQGTRTGETFAIDGRDDISLAGRWAILRDPKNGHERRVTLQPRVVAALSILPNIGARGPLFRRFDGKAFAEKIGRGGQVRAAFARAVENGGGDPKIITPHVCRHSWATWFYSQTKDTLRLKEEGGWLSNEHQRYVKLGTPEIGREAFEKGWDFTSVGENWGKIVPLIAKSGS